MKPNLLRDERKRRGWSQAQVAEALGITTKTVIRWELGRAVPFPYYREKLFALFGKTVQELGILEDADEKGTFKRAVPPVVQSSISDIPLRRSFLADPAIPVYLKSGDALYRRDSLLTLAKKSLFAADMVFLTALDDLPSLGKTALATALVVDQQVQTHFRDGILWAKLGFHPNVLDILTRWGRLLGIASTQIKSLEGWRKALQAAIGTRQMLLVIDHACRAEDAQALRIEGTACTHLVTTHLSEVALAFAHQGAIIVSQLEGADKVALLQRAVPHFVEQRDSLCR